jgi:hypothetical protein
MVWRGSACADGDCARRCGQNRMHTLRTAQAVHSAYLRTAQYRRARSVQPWLGSGRVRLRFSQRRRMGDSIRFGPFGRMTVAVSAALIFASGRAGGTAGCGRRCRGRPRSRPSRGRGPVQQGVARAHCSARHTADSLTVRCEHDGSTASARFAARSDARLGLRRHDQCLRTVEVGAVHMPPEPRLRQSAAIARDTCDAWSERYQAFSGVLPQGIGSASGYCWGYVVPRVPGLPMGTSSAWCMLRAAGASMYENS